MLRITPHHVEAVYECLRAFEPFTSLPLPAAEAVEFVVQQRSDIYAQYAHTGRDHQIKVSSALIGSFETLVQTVAHEMLHLAQVEEGTDSRSQHNERWRTLARKVCRSMVWDERAF